MIKFFLYLSLMVTGVFADVPNQMIRLYQDGSYLESCTLGFQNYKTISANEAYASLYAFSCLNADKIDRLNTPLKTLTETAEARSNATYFALLILQKKLLIQSLYDNTPLKTLKLPTSSHLLSKIFDLYSKNKQENNSVKEYQDIQNPRQTYKLYTVVSNGAKTFAIDEYYDKILTKHHVFE